MSPTRCCSKAPHPSPSHIVRTISSGVSPIPHTAAAVARRATAAWSTGSTYEMARLRTTRPESEAVVVSICHTDPGRLVVAEPQRDERVAGK